MRSISLAAALAAASLTMACSSTSEPEKGPEACQPITCAGAGAQCGSIADGCGGTLNCGSCAQGETCGGGGAPNTCGTGACTARTCQDAGAQCGSVPDGCGGSISCGSCPSGQTCGAGGANKCGTGSCTPTTCAAHGAQCGAISDGCGGTLDCGGCEAGQRCSTGGDTANRCLDVEGNHRWSRTFPGGVDGMAFGDGGNLYVLTATQSPQLIKLSPTGTLIWAKDDVGSHVVAHVNNRPLVANHLGAWALFGCSSGCGSSFEGKSYSGAFVVRYGTGGKVAWTRPLDGTPLGMAVGALGTAAALVDYEGASGQQVVLLGADGREAWRRGLAGAQAVAIDPAGNVIVTGAAFIAKLDPDGTELWRREFEGATATIRTVDVSALGTIVAAIELSGGSFAWAGESYAHTSAPSDESAVVLVAAEPNGAERWGRFHRWGGMARVDVVPSGEVILSIARGCSYLQKYNLAGRALWVRRPTVGGCYSYDSVQANAVAANEDATAVAGEFTDTHDFGDGPQTATYPRDGFLRVFGP